MSEDKEDLQRYVTINTFKELLVPTRSFPENYGYHTPGAEGVACGVDDLDIVTGKTIEQQLQNLEEVLR